MIHRVDVNVLTRHAVPEGGLCKAERYAMEATPAGSK